MPRDPRALASCRVGRSKRLLAFSAARNASKRGSDGFAVGMELMALQAIPNRMSREVGHVACLWIPGPSPAVVLVDLNVCWHSVQRGMRANEDLTDSLLGWN